jgi:rhamnosyltransferase
MGDRAAGRPRILAYITAYRDAAAVADCLGTIAAQTWPPDRILVVDNSSVPLAVSPSESLDMVHCPDNVGVAGGWALALERAIAEGYDLLWLLDQDSQPTATCLQELVQVYRHQAQLGKPVAMVAPWVTDGTMGRSIGGAVFDRYRFTERLPDPDQSSLLDCDAPIVSGTLLSVSAASGIGPPLKELFLDGVDLEYGLRLRRHGFRNLITTTAKLQHRLGRPLAVQLWGKAYFIRNYSCLRSYYYYRNHTYLEVYCASLPFKAPAILWRLYALGKDIILTMLYRDRKLKRILACGLGTWHGFLGRLGKSRWAALETL